MQPTSWSMSRAVASEYGLFSSPSRGGNDSRPTCARTDALTRDRALLAHNLCHKTHTTSV